MMQVCEGLAVAQRGRRLPPRRQAGQPVRAARRRPEDSRLRHRAARQLEHDGQRVHRRHAGLHVAGAGARARRSTSAPTSSRPARCFYLMLTGRKPFVAPDLPAVLHKVSTEDPLPLRRRGSDRRCCRASWRRRWPSRRRRAMPTCGRCSPTSCASSGTSTPRHATGGSVPADVSALVGLSRDAAGGRGGADRAAEPSDPSAIVLNRCAGARRTWRRRGRVDVSSRGSRGESSADLGHGGRVCAKADLFQVKQLGATT